jgi:hypothetical protein
MTVKKLEVKPVYLEDERLVESYGGSWRTRADISYNSGNFGPVINVQPDVTQRSSYNTSDYTWARPGERKPLEINALIKCCMDAYDNIGIVYNVINLMSDFASAGITLKHPVKSQEKFWVRWFEKVCGAERSSNIINMFYRAGNVVIQRVDGDLDLKEANTWKAQAVKALKIPLKYVIHNPRSLQVFGGPVSGFLGKPYFLLKVASDIVMGLRMLEAQRGIIGEKEYKKLFSEIPAELKALDKNAAAYIKLDQDELYPYYYKKDDGQIWARPLVAPILPDLMQLAKTKLADNSALDGVISNIRLWNLGHLTDNIATTILPTRAAINKLRNIVSNNVGGGVFDLVWGPELKFTESNTQTHNFLGKSKYEPIWNHIYEGLGIPPTLTGNGGGSGGFTNNSIALKTLIDRLDYGRNVLIDFWTKQIRIVQKAMGFAKPPQLSFDQMSLSDESAIKTLLVQLVDRDIISHKTVQEAFGITSDSENAQIKRETKKRGAKIMPPKAGSFHNPQTEEDMKKMALQGGGVAPSEVGLDLAPRKKGEKNTLEKTAELTPKTPPAFAPKNKNGRPKNSKDGTKRKQKVVKPKAFIETFMWAETAQSSISEILTPTITKSLGKKNVRQLSNDETQALEDIKFSTLCALKPFQEISEEILYNLIEEKLPEWAYSSFAELKDSFVTKNHRQPTIEEIRQIQSSVFALQNEKDE